MSPSSRREFLSDSFFLAALTAAAVATPSQVMARTSKGKPSADKLRIGVVPVQALDEVHFAVDAALAAYTSGVAYQAGRADAGYVRPGAVADLVWLAQDPHAVDPMTIGAIPVRGTWFRGRRTFHG